MNCNAVQNLLSAYIDCELDCDQKREVRKHLFNCAECSFEYEQMLLLKECMFNIQQEELSFDPLAALNQRLQEEKRSLVPRNSNVLWNFRTLLAAACLILFFLSTLMMFPVNQKSSTVARDNNSNQYDTYDQNLSLDQGFNVYQASLILP